MPQCPADLDGRGTGAEEGQAICHAVDAAATDERHPHEFGHAAQGVQSQWQHKWPVEAAGDEAVAGRVPEGPPGWGGDGERVCAGLDGRLAQRSGPDQRQPHDEGLAAARAARMTSVTSSKSSARPVEPSAVSGKPSSMPATASTLASRQQQEAASLGEVPATCTMTGTGERAQARP